MLRQLLAAAAELLPYLTELLWFLGTPIAWVWQLVRLIGFVVVLLPLFLPPAWQYLRSGSIQKGVRYGPSVRHALDIYVPVAGSEGGVGYTPLRCPVVLFVSGGAWIIGYRMWGFLLGLALQRRGIMCVSVDYRNFPQSRIPDMVDDVADACAWVHEHIASYGGDPSNVSIVGQSAGAHLTALLLLHLVGATAPAPASAAAAATAVTAAAPGAAPCISAAAEAPAPSAAGASRHEAAVRSGALLPRRWIGISGPYDMERIVPVLRKRGLHPALMDALACGDLAACSPIALLAKGGGGEGGGGEGGHLLRHAVPRTATWPPLALFHGTADRTVDWRHSADFASALRAAGAPHVRERYFADKSHTDPILEDPLFSHADPLLEDLVAMVLEGAAPSLAAEQLGAAEGAGPASVAGRAWLHAAKWINPF